MKFRKPTHSTLLPMMIAVSVAGSMALITLAVPVKPSLQPRQDPPLTSPPAHRATATPECRQCLYQELSKIGDCDKLSQSIPPPPTDQDPAKVEEYKATYPAAVSCLCQAANQSEGENSWIERCDEVCTGAVEKYQKRLLATYGNVLNCKAGSDTSLDAAPSPVTTDSNPTTPMP
ncbi:MAG: hypothetical protein J3Q66DRAFT_367734 [Benniella sp.]|nr:MAG: hypothetical protein J3Q66DRAFT_367734 [Benniella sp.]